MPDHNATGLAGKGKRVVGTFLWLLGAGTILDAHVLQLGVPVAVFGVIFFVWGAFEARAAHVAASSHPADVGARMAEPSEVDP